MNNLTLLNFDERRLTYRVVHGEYGGTTYFYEGTELVPKWNFLWWHSTNHVLKPKLIGEITCDIEEPHLTKQRVRELIQHMLDLVDRKEQLERGELI